MKIIYKNKIKTNYFPSGRILPTQIFIKRLIICINALLRFASKSSFVVVIAAAVAGWANRVERRSGISSKGFKAVGKGFRAVSKGFGAVGGGRNYRER